MPANCSAQTSSLSVAICSPLDLDVMASSSFPAGAAVKFWVPNLGARAPVDLTTGLPGYSDYVKSVQPAGSAFAEGPEKLPICLMETDPGQTPRQKWKASFLAYFLGAVSQGQLMVMKQLGDESYAASLADQNCWQVRTSKRLTYTLRHNHDLRTLTASSRPFAGRLTRSWVSFLGIPRRGLQSMFSFVVCATTISEHRLVRQLVGHPRTL